jgi:hypothetical protein
MRFVAFAGEKSVSELVKAHYGALGGADAKRAEKLVLDANPALKALKSLPRGAVLRLPGIVTKRPVAVPDDEEASVRSAVLAELLRGFTDELKAAIESEATALKADQKVDPDVKKMIDQVPEAGDLFEQVRRGLKQREERRVAAQELLKQLPGMQDVIEQLLTEPLRG